MTITVAVTVEVNEAELAKRNRKAKAGGRAETTAAAVVEEVISDALKHNWITAEHTVETAAAYEARRFSEHIRRSVAEMTTGGTFPHLRT